MIPGGTHVLLLQETISDTITQTINEAIAFLPNLVGALVILLVGWIVGRLLGALVERIIRGIGIGDYSRGTAVEEVSDGDDGIARAIGKLVAFYVYFVALVAAANILGIQALSDILSDLGDFLPVILGAVVVLVVGFIAGRVIGDIVADVVSGFNFRRYLRDTPLERFSDQEGEFGRLVGLVVTYYIYLLTLLAVADIVQIEALSTLLNEFAAYLPALIGGLVVLLVGIWIAERVGDLVAGSDPGRMTDVAGLAVKLIIYFITATVALDALGFGTALLTSVFVAFVVSFFGALGLALAIGIGVALGLGGQEYVRQNIGRWGREVRQTVEEGGGPSSGGTPGDDTMDD